MLIHNAVVFVDGGFHRDIAVRTQGERIAALGALRAEPGEEIFDARGHFLLPGFVDIHIHGCAGYDTMQGEAAVRRMAQHLGEQGVAAFLPTTMSASPADTLQALRGVRAAMARPSHGAQVLGAHMEAPFMCAQYGGAQDTAHFTLPSLEAYAALTGEAADIVRLMTLAPELPGSRALMAVLTAQGVRIACAHSAATAEQLHEAADWGLSQVTHLFNAQTPLHHRQPGIPGAALTDARVAVQVIADMIHLHPDTVRLALLAKRGQAQGVLLITDAMMAAGMSDGVYTLGGQQVTVQNGAARLANGALAGSTLTLHRALRNLIVGLGIAPEEAVPLATEAPARSIGAQDVGRIAVGCRAAFALMDGGWHFVQAL